MGKRGQGKIGNLPQIVSFFSDFPPISFEFHTFFPTFSTTYFWHFLTFPHSPPIFSMSSHFPPLPSILLFSPGFVYLSGALANSAAANADACIMVALTLAMALSGLFSRA